MPTARESRAALQLVTAGAVATAVNLLRRVSGSPEAKRAALLDGVPEVVGYYAEGAAALAVDFYEDERERAGVLTPYRAELVIVDRTVQLRRAIAWSADPLITGEDVDPAARLAEVVQLETARPYRDTITENRRRDPQAVGWQRITSGTGCRFCRMLADRGAVYSHLSARFAAHSNCHCTAAPVFGTNDMGEPASVLQYVASKKNRTAKEKAALKKYLDENYGPEIRQPRPKPEA